MTSSDFAPVFKHIEQLVATGGLPSAVFGVATSQGVADLRAFNAKPDDVYPLFSVTKPIMGLAIAQLWERGLIGLNDPVTKYFPAFGAARPDRQHVVIRHLLTHTSGIDGGLNEALKSPLMLSSEHKSDGLDRFINAGYLFPAGRFKQYNNLAFYGLQGILEQVTGLPLGRYLQVNLWEALGVGEIGFDLFETIAERMRHPEGREILNYDYNLRSKSPSGGLQSSAAPLLALGTALLNGGGGIVKPLTLAAMTRTHTAGVATLRDGAEFIGSDVGITWMLPLGHHDYLVRTQYGHDGWGGCMFWMYPESDHCFVLLTNLMDPAGHGVMLDRLHNIFAACVV